MRRTSLVTAVATVAVLSLCTVAYADNPTPNWAAYQGSAVDPAGQPLQGTYDLQFRYLDSQGETELLIEKQSRIPINEGRFQVKLGTGEIVPHETHASLEEVFANHPELLMEISIDGRAQNPWIRILPAGHSPASAAALSGPVGTDGKTLHWKGWDARSPMTGA